MTEIEPELLRELAPRVLGALVRRYGNFADAEDAVQEALLSAVTTWPVDGVPDQPAAWLTRVASRRMIDQYRQATARRSREELATARALTELEPASADDDSLLLMFMCCHPSLAPAASIPLTLRAVGGLTTREIATAFLIPEATLAQRISRAKSRIKTLAEPFAYPPATEYPERVTAVNRVLYLMFNEGYATSHGAALTRPDLSNEAIRLARRAQAARPDDPEVSGLLALMLLTDARRSARTGPNGELIPLADQDRAGWDRDLIREGVALITAALRRGPTGEYQLQAAIAAVHDQAASHADTEWPKVVALYRALEGMTGNPMVALNRAIAVAMVDGPDAGIAIIDELPPSLADHHRVHAARAHLLELRGDLEASVHEYRSAASRSTSRPEQDYLTMRAARLAATLTR